MDIKTRLEKLEASITVESQPVNICWFSVWPENRDVIGYIHEETGEFIIRNHGETDDELRSRCSESVRHKGSWHIFKPIFNEGSHEHKKPIGKT